MSYGSYEQGSLIQTNQEIEMVQIRKDRCLIANDDMMQLECLKSMFILKDFEVVTAINGYEAYLKVSETMEDLKLYFDLVILDLHMPISDGYEACSKILDLYKDGIFKKKRPRFNFSIFNPIMVACSSLIN
jgi:CheY-like chemotaxis protein